VATASWAPDGYRLPARRPQHEPAVFCADRADAAEREWLFRGLLPFGVRWFGDRLAVGFGFVYVLGSDQIEGWPLVPWVDFAVNW